MKVRDQLLDLAAKLALFSDHRGTSFASIPRGAGYPLNVPLNSPELRNYLFGEFEKTCAGVPNTAAYRDLLPVLASRAQDSPVPRRALDSRISGDGPRFAPDTIYLNLGNDEAEAVEITASGWNVRDAKALYFRGARQSYSLPGPEPDGPSLDSLLETLTGLPAEVRRRCQDWMLAAMRPTGPYPILVLQGAPGSGKSTLARLLRQTLDPSSDPIPALPNTPRRFEAHAEQNRVLAFDHVTHISRQLSAVLCTAAQPILLTMPDGAKLDPELTSRAVIIELPEIHGENRRTEAGIFEKFHRVRAQMLGALCTLTSHALANLNETTPAALPRHADAAAWTAASPPLLEATPRAPEPRAFASGLWSWLGQRLQVPPLSPASRAFIPGLVLL
jgi:hypothetical protein